ncbi:GLPGLI family protein [Flavobacterium sp. UBA6135]|uniref:GLPGLI family protein n=1 Tax=Flavobacterium sp. UBA6135 TaxID=1946553 RepID=UPI0025BA7D45|nr:GLPGLI family protein [Flavobacterium sp. UBA6135]
MSKYIIKYVCICLLFNSYFFFAQEIVGGNPSFPSDPYNVKNIDVANQNIFYEYTYVKNTDEKLKTNSALTILQVGTNYSKYVDFYTLKLDSLREKHSKLNRIEKKEISEQMEYRREIGFKMTIIKNFKNTGFIAQSRIPNNDYEFEIMFPKLQWKLVPEYKTILDYKTQKAIIYYSGRNWIAWFAESIPIHLGPYTFGDLPGLILELYDEDNNHHFIAIGIDQKPHIIYKREEKKTIKTAKKEFFKTEKSFHDRPDLFFDINAVRGVDNFPKIPYNPIELD